MEPRAATPNKRLRTIEELSKAGIPTVVMLGPIIPGLNDHEIENILKSAASAGAKEAGYTMLRLPFEVKGIFKDWLQKEFPDRYYRVMSNIKDVRSGRETSSQFGERMTGSGPVAWTIGRRFQLACQRLGLNASRVKLRHDLFAKPAQPGEQLNLI
jgi:DNA repair photolyase